MDAKVICRMDYLLLPSLHRSKSGRKFVRYDAAGVTARVAIHPRPRSRDASFADCFLFTDRQAKARKVTGQISLAPRGGSTLNLCPSSPSDACRGSRFHCFWLTHVQPKGAFVQHSDRSGAYKQRKLCVDLLPGPGHAGLTHPKLTSSDNRMDASEYRRCYRIAASKTMRTTRSNDIS